MTEKRKSDSEGNSGMKPNVFFFIGTEAELIKVFPVMIECMNQGGLCHIIASGQNDLTRSRIMKVLRLNGKFIELSKESQIKKSAVGLLKWFIRTYRIAVNSIEEHFDRVELKGAPMVVHGDTVSTFMGARIGKKLGCLVCHVEAGLRSHHLFNPFPEEIDRLLTSRVARLHFAPGDEPEQNLKKVKGRVINTQQNTLLDSLRFSERIPIQSNIEGILEEEYFIFVMHRQENLANKKFVCDVVTEITKITEHHKCVIILHEITRNTFDRFGLMDKLKINNNIILQPRVDYFDFMKLLQNSHFVITDGGSNQEELFYMNKPCLIMRKTTERTEGLGVNARLFGGEASDIGAFVAAVEHRKVRPVKEVLEGNPSRMIAEELLKKRL